MATSAIGDAYLELGNPDQAVRYYLKASKRDINDFTTPVFLMKAAQTYEHMGKWNQAIDIYKRIKKEHFQTQEGRDAEKFIAHAQAMMR
jgi:tetratricopeptide (TPR) repeat protein